MSKFTPGEWEALKAKGYHIIRLAPNGEREVGKVIAYVLQWYQGEDWGTARLIAAAPEMYELLKEVAQCEGDYVADTVFKAQELLARIDGEGTENE